MVNYKEALQNKFTQVYNQLNTQQQTAVNTIEGPVMVIAGPGTGKTQILAARIANILLNTDAQPDNILCLTYTDAGTIAMRKRLQQFIGADAYKVNIYTFHAFCNDVIQDNLSLFEKNSLDAISELESIQLFKTLIDNFQKEHPLKRYRGDVYFEINNLKNLFSSMKREGWSAPYIITKINEYITDLSNRDEYIAKRATKEFKKGDVRTDKIAAENEKMLKLTAAVNEFDNYQQLMRKKNRYDFDDMINWVIQVFEQNKDVLAQYQEKFQYVLVDEYQDTSGTQNNIVSLLINYWDKPNVFVVGDDDQSVYRFQGANVENMLDFASTYTKDLITIVLTNNYRSTQPILDIAKTLIDNNQERLVKKLEGLSKDLVAANNQKKLFLAQPAITAYSSAKEEMADITNQIQALLNNHIQPGKIAVIYKENKYGLELAEYFTIKNIPYYSKKSINILTNPFVKKLILVLRFLQAEHDIPYGGDEILFEILHADFYKIPAIEVAKLTVEFNQAKYGNKLASLRSYLQDKANQTPTTLFDKGIHPGLKKISAVLEKLISDASNNTLQQLFSNIIQNAGIIPYIIGHKNKIELLQLLTGFFNFIKEETSRNPYMQLNELMNIIEVMEKEKLPLPLLQIAGNEKGVNLLTAHGSKGLEFEYVFFAGVNASAWEKKRKPAGGYKLPDTMFASAGDNKLIEEEELRRLFYVALTRAEKYLYISYPLFKNDGKLLEPSMFIAEILQQHPLTTQNVSLSKETLFDFEILQYTATAPEIDSSETDFIDGILSKFVMNVTALNNYLDCPLGFYYKNLIRIPTGKSEATEFGSAIHYALEQLFKNMLTNNNKAFDPIEKVVSNFNWYIERHRENFTKEAFNRRIEQGSIILPAYYNTYVQSWNKVVAVERNIRGVMVGDVPLKGKLDKLEFDGNNVNVVDYKSGDIDKALAKMKGPNDKEPNGGGYWRQAVFYKILVDNYNQKNWNVVSTEFDYVEPDKNKQYRKEKIVISPADIETVKQQIQQTWQKIQDKAFYTGCGKADCQWCNFVKDNQLAIELHPIDDAEEE